MCHQSVGLVQSVIEKAGIPTVSITLLPEVTRCVRPPRALVVDRPLGYPLAEPGNAVLQKEIIQSALKLVQQPVSDPLIVEFQQVSVGLDSVVSVALNPQSHRRLIKALVEDTANGIRKLVKILVPKRSENGCASSTSS